MNNSIGHFPSVLLLLLIGLLSQCNLSPINDDNNQHQLQITSAIVNQPTSTVTLSTRITQMSWKRKLKNITEQSGRTVLLECQVQSEYPVSFQWYRYNNPLDPHRFQIHINQSRSSLQIKNLKETQAGFYTCEVSNGFHRLTSTGFVRVQNPEIDPIELSEDLLPPIYFSPVSIENQEGKIEKLQCDLYRGSMCRSILNSKYVSITNVKHKEIEENLFNHMKILSEECRRFLLPMVCLFIYPICDEDRAHLRSICRQSCYFYQNHPCARGIAVDQTPDITLNFQSLYHLPTCKNLPPASDDATCVVLDPYQNVSSPSSPTSIVDPSSISDHLFSLDSFFIVLLSICLPIAIISLLLFFFFCYYRRRTTMNHSLRSDRIKSTPLHSIHNRQIHQPILPSSSSSTRTNLTNLPLRQTLPLENNCLGEVSAENIRFLKEIGEGDYGKIYLGELIDNKRKCLIKSLETEKGADEYLREIEIFRHIRHSNVSCLLGVCLQSHNTFSFMIYESLNQGDLHEYVIQHSETIDSRDFLHFALQIVSGMVYLSDKNLQHNDLALRNILVSEFRTIKITNIARCCPKYYSDYYKIANRALPVRWMAIESLLSGIYSQMTDVWSFGVLLWELFSYGVQPYYGYTNPEVIEMIRDRQLLACPMNCSKRIYTLMCTCWEEFSDQRPTFIQLMERLSKLHETTILASSSSPESSSIDDMESSGGRNMFVPSLFVDSANIRFHT